MEHVDTVMGRSGYSNEYGCLDCTRLSREASITDTRMGAKPQAKLQDVSTEKLQWSKLGIWLLLGFSLYVAIVTLNLTAAFLYPRSIPFRHLSECNVFFSVFIDCRG